MTALILFGIGVTWMLDFKKDENTYFFGAVAAVVSLAIAIQWDFHFFAALSSL